MAIQIDDPTRNAMGDALIAQIGNAATLRIYSGSPPADETVAPTGTLLSQHTLASPFAPATAGGVVSPTLPSNVNALASGTAGYYRIFTSGGVSKHQGNCGTSGTDMILNTTSIVVGGPVQVNSWSITMGG